VLGFVSRSKICRGYTCTAVPIGRSLPVITGMHTFLALAEVTYELSYDGHCIVIVKSEVRRKSFICDVLLNIPGAQPRFQSWGSNSLV